jgi:hypothetical protein
MHVDKLYIFFEIKVVVYIIYNPSLTKTEKRKIIGIKL